MLVERDLDAIGVQVNRPTLDDVFLTVTGRSLRDDISFSDPADRAA
jgi:ABC-2 type transport system ATP-binding protein